MSLMSTSLVTLADEADTPTVERTVSRWAGVVGVEGQVTGDGRLLEAGSLRWEGLPLPFRDVQSDVGGHDGATVVGNIETLERVDDGTIWGTGTFDLGSEAGREAARQVEEGYKVGVSMDLDDVTFEIRVAADLLTPPDAEDDNEPDAEIPAENIDEDGRVTVVSLAPDDELQVTTDGRIRAATLVAIPAFSTAKIAMTSGPEAPTEEEELAAVESDAADVDAIVAAAAIPVAPPTAWFLDPHLTEGTPFTVTDDGRVYGHMALWGTCHTSHTSSGQCITPPNTATGYAYYRTGSVLTKEGDEIPTGRITLDTRHAGPKLNANAAAAHYDNSGYAAVDVAAGEDQSGIWLAGAVRPGTTPEQVRALRGAPLSGDWRRIGGNLELIGVLAVNVPGFPIPRPAGLVASGVLATLTASGMLPPPLPVGAGRHRALSTGDLKYLKRLADRERAEETRENLTTATALARRVRSSRNEMKVRAFAASRTQK